MERQGFGVYSIKCLSFEQEDLGSSPRNHTKTPGVVTDTFSLHCSVCVCVCVCTCTKLTLTDLIAHIFSLAILPAVAVYLCNPNTGEVETRGPGSYWLASLAQLVSSRLLRDHILKEGGSFPKNDAWAALWPL
jgi:hypothetical protein